MVDRCKWCFLALLLFFFSVAKSQEKPVYLDSILVTSYTYSDSANQQLLISDFLRHQWRQGYIFCQVQYINDSALYISRGEKAHLSVSQVYETGTIDTLTISGKNIFGYLDQRLSVLGDNGYPFASAQIVKLEAAAQNYKATISIDLGPFIRYDKLQLASKIKTDAKYLEKVLGVERDQPFSEKAYSMVPARVKRLPYLHLQQPSEVVFQDGRANIMMNLVEQSTNSFEGIIGLLPEPTTNDYTLTGFLNLEMNNLFNSGKAFSFLWNRFDAQSQMMNLEYDHPFLLETALFLDLKFGLLKQDTCFVNQSWSIGLGSYIGSSTRLNATYQVQTGNLAANTQFERTDNLFDYQRKLYGLTADIHAFDWAFGFESGWKLKTNFLAGNKVVQRNPTKDQSIYDSIQLKSDIYILEAFIKYQQTFRSGLAIFHSVGSGNQLSDQVLSNEAYRLGGLRTVRGFDEQIFYAKYYALSRLELRQYFERKSYFMLFYDQLFYQGESISENPMGLGIGFTLATDNSLFNFAMAAGKTDSQSFDLAATKIHFGYTSKF